MAEPTLQQIFGTGATQTATTITIVKADLPGLTPAADNRAEPVFVGILLRAKSFLTPANQEANSEQSITITDPDFNADSLVQRNNQTYRQKTQSVNLQKLDTSTEIDPDDY